MQVNQLTRSIPSSLMDYIDQMDHRLSERTQREYTARLKDLSRKITARLTDPGTALTPSMFIEEIQSQAVSGAIAASTFRLYKSAIMYWLAQQSRALMDAGEDPNTYSHPYSQLRSLQYPGPASPTQRTSAKKLKFFSEESIQALTHYAQERGHRAPTAVRAQAFVKANLLVGLRPSEWLNVSFASYLRQDEQGKPLTDPLGNSLFEHMLIVHNAKNTHGRAGGEQRELILHNITTDELKALMHFAEIARTFKERFPDNTDSKTITNLLYRPMNNILRRALGTAGFADKDIPSIYSTRHQAVADFKASDYDHKTIAAFFGHSSERTHREHYGHKKHGSRTVTFRPSPQTLRQVKTPAIQRQASTMPQALSTQAEQWAAQRLSREQNTTQHGNQPKTQATPSGDI